MQLKKFFLSTLIFFISLSSFAAEIVTTDDFISLYQKVQELSLETNPEKILVVYDIDNTLLAMNQNLGSDQWYNWQAGLLANGGPRELMVADSFDGLLNVQGLLFAMSHMHPPQSDEPMMVRNLQVLGVKDLVLTSRGPDFRDATQRELKRNGYDFSNSTIGPQGGFASTYLPYYLTQPEKSGLSQDDVKQFALAEAKPVSFMNGIYMTSGQHKGIMLRTLLYHTRSQFSHIVFIDDTLKHSQRMLAAFVGKPVTVHPFFYTREQQNVKAFEAGDKREVIDGWNAIKSVIDKYLPLSL